MRRTKAEAKETRQQILLAAEKVFYEKGVAHASMEDVARAAGVTRGAIYWHFANRADLVLELYNSLPMPQEDLIARELEAENADVFAVLERVGREWLELLATDEHRQRILSILLRCDTSGEFSAISERQNDLDDEHMQALEAAFAKAEKQGKLCACWTPRSAASMLRWVIKGLCSEWLLFGRRFDIASEGRDALRRLFATYSSHAPSAR
ncbi:TetR family transcriptional regulator [Shinella yambaruensis]|uniref:TetR family transcriptional regulator n=1 Tax=Shinella yambaruensis TaxID=415996 RepID=A0ABQ5ZLP6_9HYPH|nr:TetR family transcriptional regulator [Shinella yambaruensis]MCJ8025278.1 TetR family transcriptional regulator [Shinella yambaruensis]MCU7981088.1 TetR family transcriptional regulator [Shinella yambaruensis]GLR53770.1 TetR family transcriptional regulator [Shinella yambaruensis]